MKPGPARTALSIFFSLGLFTLLASLFFSWWTVRIMALGVPGILWAFWRYLFLLAPYPGDGWALLYSAGVGALPIAVIQALPRRFTVAGARVIRRGNSGIHGDTRWLSMTIALTMLSADENGVNVVLGEAIRMDLTPFANVRFVPKDEATWGPGGTGQLLYDKGEEMGGGHGISFLAPGGGKTQEIATAIAYYGKSVFVQDPACELADMIREIQEEKGHKVYVLEPDGDVGFNALGWINIADPLADVNVRVQVGRMYGKTSERPGQHAAHATTFFRDQGKNLVVCLLAHLLWHPGVPDENKTLRAVRGALVQPTQELRDTLEGIYLTSESELARDLAGPLFKMVDETFDGIASNAQEATAWLSVRPYANMVSGNTYDPAELCNGKTTVLNQIPLKALIENPEVARTVVGAHMGAIMEAEGEVDGRVLFKLDEAVLLGSDNMLRVGRSQGRKYRIILCPYYQSLGQALEVWGEHGLRAWMGEVTWIRFGPTMDGKDAKELTELLGTFGAMSTSHGKNRGRQARFGEMQSVSHGTNDNEHEVARPLLRPFELQRLRRDERIVLYTNSEPLRITAALAHRRPELRGRLGQNRFRRKYPRPGLRRVA